MLTESLVSGASWLLLMPPPLPHRGSVSETPASGPAVAKCRPQRHCGVSLRQAGSQSEMGTADSEPPSLNCCWVLVVLFNVVATRLASYWNLLTRGAWHAACDTVTRCRHRDVSVDFVATTVIPTQLVQAHDRPSMATASLSRGA